MRRLRSGSEGEERLADVFGVAIGCVDVDALGAELLKCMQSCTPPPASGMLGHATEWIDRKDRTAFMRVLAQT
jgi:hypothetical protein